MLKNHPKGLMVLFFSEMWERFGYYTMLAILTLYMEHYFGWPDEKKGQVYGIFLGFIYFTPLIGGFVADRFWGYRRTIVVGAVMYGIGYSMLAIPGPSEWFFYVCLMLLCVGNGFFKGNISVMVGNLYDKHSPLKDAGFNIFYMGINVGAFMAPIVATNLRNQFGFNAAFGAAAVGMIFSLIIFTLGQRMYKKSLADKDQADENNHVDEVISPKKEKERIRALVIVYLIVIFFWMSFHQNGFALTLFADRSTASMDLSPGMRSVMNFVMGISESSTAASEAEFYQVFNPMFILLLTPLVVAFWGWLNKRGREPMTPAKIGIGMALTGIGFGIMIVASYLGGDLDEKIMSPWWLISSYYVQTLAELCLSPMGLSYASKMAPARMRGLLMGGWFMATAIGNYLAGFVGSFYSQWSHTMFFTVLTVSCFVSAGMILIFLKRLKEAQHPEIPPADSGAVAQPG